MATLTTSFQKFSEVSIYSGSYLQVWAKYTSQSVANNQTTVVAELRIHNDPNTGYNCYTHIMIQTQVITAIHIVVTSMVEHLLQVIIKVAIIMVGEVEITFFYLKHLL